MDIVLRDYQSQSIDALRDNIRRGVMNQILCAPTGAGKTVMGAYLLQEAYAKGSRAMFVVDRVPLIDQTSETLDHYGIPHGVIQGQHWRWRPWERIQVASAQTLARRKWPDVDLLIIDEAHTMYTTVRKRLQRRDVVAIGLTATPFTRGLGAYYDDVVSVTTTDKLIEEGRLASYRIYAASEPDMAGAALKGDGEWQDREVERRALPIVGDCVAEYLKHAAGKKFIAFGSTIAHCEEIQRQFMAAGVVCGLYTARTGDTERQGLLEDFSQPDGHMRGLVSVAALAKGFDRPDVECVILARPLRKSLAEHIQMIGRGLRPHPGKEECIILDHAGNTMRFWDAMQDFFANGASELDDGTRRETKVKPKDAPEPRKCPTCAHIHRPAPFCPSCGFEYPRRKSEVEHLAGTLTEVGGAVAKEEERVDLYAQLLWIARERGYKLGWAAHKYKERVGRFPPRNFVPDPKPASPALKRWVRSRMIAYAKARAA